MLRGLRNSLAMLAQTVLAHCTNAPHPLQRRLVIGERWFCMSRAPVAVDDAAFIDTSFPGFATLMNGLAGGAAMAA